MSPPRFASRKPPRKYRGQGVVTLELLLVMPLLIILVLAVIEFGVFFAHAQQVALAARDGAIEASESNLSTTDGDPVPNNVLSIINQQLESSGMSSCRVRLEHNVGVMAPIALVSGNCDCGPLTTLVDLPPDEYVRLTVCVPLQVATPNLLAMVGFDTNGRFIECTTVLRHE